MEEIKPCPECEEQLVWSYMASAWWCDKCEEFYTEEQIDSLRMSANYENGLSALRAENAALRRLVEVERKYGDLRYEEATASIVPRETMKAARKDVDAARANLEELCRK